MTDKTTPSNTEASASASTERTAAMLALYATQGSIAPADPPPTTEELALLVDEQLDFTRKQQVYGHLNADRQLMKQWLDLVDARHLLQAQPPLKRSSLLQAIRVWLTPARSAMAGGVCTGVLAVALLAPALWQTPPNLAQQPPMQPAIGSPELASQANTQVEVGIRYGLMQALQQLSKAEQRNLGLILPTEVSSSDHSQAIALGYAILEAHQACRGDKNWQPSPLLQAQLNQLLPSLGDSPQLCLDLTRYTKGLLAVN